MMQFFTFAQNSKDPEFFPIFLNRNKIFPVLQDVTLSFKSFYFFANPIFVHKF